MHEIWLLKLDLPAIQLHGSTRCDNCTVEKAKSLGDVAFSQLVLAREPTIAQIRAIRAQVDMKLEYFIHGALYVDFPGSAIFRMRTPAAAPPTDSRYRITLKLAPRPQSAASRTQENRKPSPAHTC